MRVRVAVLGVLLLTAATTATSGLVLAQEDDGGCLVPDDAWLHEAGRPTEAGHYPHEEWIAGPGAQRALDNVNRALEAQFGTTTKTDATTPLDAGLVGLTLDHVSKEVVVVADFDRVDEDALERRLRGLVQASDSGRTPFDIDVSPSCRPVAELHRASDVLRGRSWHSRADDVAFGSYLDPKTSTYSATFSREDADVALALEEELGDGVTIEWGSPQRDGRLDDGEPHYGGAGIRISTQTSNTCTSGFTVVFSNGLRGSVTAGHCYNNGYNVYSGPQYYGRTEGRSPIYPSYDMIRIGPNGEAFTFGLHVDPCCPSVREVVSDSNAGLGNLICISGMVTKAKCGLEVINTNGQFCDSDGCTYGLVVAEKPGETVRQGGDSGAPMYTRPGAQTATIKGMHIAGTDPSTSYSEKISSVEGHLGVSVLHK